MLIPSLTHEDLVSRALIIQDEIDYKRLISVDGLHLPEHLIESISLYRAIGFDFELEGLLSLRECSSRYAHRREGMNILREHHGWKEDQRIYPYGHCVYATYGGITLPGEINYGGHHWFALKQLYKVDVENKTVYWFNYSTTCKEWALSESVADRKKRLHKVCTYCQEEFENATETVCYSCSYRDDDA